MATTPVFILSKANIPVFHVKCVTHRKDPIYLTTVVGRPPQEDFYMGYAIERVFLPLMKMTIRNRRFSMPAEGIVHNLMIVSIRKSFPGTREK